MATITVYDLEWVELETISDIADEAAAWVWHEAREDKEEILWVYNE